MARLSDFRIEGEEYDEIVGSLTTASFTEMAIPGAHSNHFASLYEHHAYPELLIRLTSGADGFAQYAQFTRSYLESWIGTHAPIVHDMTISADETLVCLVDRLQAVPEELEALELIAYQALRSRGNYEHFLRPSALRYLQDEQPLFLDFMKQMHAIWPGRAFDSMPGNILFRDGRLIVNDPIGTCLTTQEICNLRYHLPLPELPRQFQNRVVGRSAMVKTFSFS